METVFRLNDKELTPRFFETIKELFKNQEIEITVRTAPSETDYLFASESNKNHLLKAIEEVKANKNLIRFSVNEFDALNIELTAQ